MKNKDYLIDNKKALLRDHFIALANNAKLAKLATGYFYLNGYRLVSESMKSLDKAQLIIGNEINLTVGESQQEAYKKYVKENMLEDLSKIEDESLREKIKELYDLLQSEKLQVKIYNKGNFHSKLYIFIGKSKTAIVGSSNFTKPGLVTNVELNIIEERDEKVDELVNWFDYIWENESEEFRLEMLNLIESSGVLDKQLMKWGKYVPPQELFKILAYEILDGRVDLVREKKILALFQEIGVLNSEDKISKYYGCLIADSVGLGKSFIGAEILKDYLYGKKDFWDGKLKEKWSDKGKGCLLIVPAHLKKQWRDDVLKKNFFTNCIFNSIDGEFHFKVIDKSKGELGQVKIMSYSKFSREKPNSLTEMSNLFDVILIDEAHKFRDEESLAWKNVQFLKKKQAYKIDLGYEVPENPRNRFILLSATPLNNRISDLVNLFKIFLDRDLRDLTRQGKNVKLFDNYYNIKKDLKTNPNNKELKEKLKNTIRKIKNELLDDLMILRTRKYIKDSPKYKGTEIAGKPLIFKDPNIKRVQYDKDLEEYYKDYLDLYNGLAEFLEKLEYPYIDLFLIEENRKTNLRALLKILLLKRIESSIFSFDISIQHIKQKELFLIQLLNKLNDFDKIKKEWQKKYGKREEEFDSDEELGILAFEETEDENEKEQKSKVKLNIKELLKKAKNDLVLIEQYEKKIEKVRRKNNKYNDAKLEKLKLILSDIYENGGDIPKLILFTQFKDTAKYLFDELKEWTGKSSNNKLRKLGMEIVSGDVDIETKERRLKRFAPIANEFQVEKEEEINFLVSTDALSEGVNLQDASIVINYDLPWNPMRIVQRVGRVNRIGSEKEICVFNFFPDRDLEELLKLLKKLWDKIEDVQNLLSKEMQILSEEEEVTVDTIGEKIKRERQETDIRQLEMNTRSADFKIAEVYGEDEETIQKIKIISKLMELGISEAEFRNLEDMFKELPYYTLIENSSVLRLYRIFDKIRNEKMKNFLIRYDKDGKVVPFDEILELINKKEGKKIVDLTDEEVKDLKKRIHSCDKIFEEKIYYDYKQLFTALRQGQIQSFEGIHRKVVKYLRAVSEQRRLISFSEEEKARLLRVRQIYESMKLRTSETKDLKQWFGNAGVDVESDDLSKIGPQKIVEVLEKFFDEYLSQKPDTYFGGIRTDKDLDYKIIGWTA